MLKRFISEIYQKLDYSVADLEAAAGGKIAISDDKSTVIMARMRNPSLSIHGIEGAFSGGGAKTVIPATVGGKFSIRYVLHDMRLSNFQQSQHVDRYTVSCRPRNLMTSGPKLKNSSRQSSRSSTPSAS